MWVGDPKHRKEASHARLKKLAHAVWECKYHIVWCPKYRFQILKGELGRSVREIIRQLSQQSVSHVVGYLKGKSAIALFNRHGQLKKRYWGRHFWARGYCVGTVGLDEEMIRKYVKWQIAKDQTMDQLNLFEQ
jgi:putative transposase